jgi:hypothetical protein
MGLNNSEQHEAALEGLAKASPIVTIYSEIEVIYLEHADSSRLTKEFEKSLIKLYKDVLVYNVTAACYFNKSKLDKNYVSLP